MIKIPFSNYFGSSFKVQILRNRNVPQKQCHCFRIFKFTFFIVLTVLCTVVGATTASTKTVSLRSNNNNNQWTPKTDNGYHSVPTYGHASVLRDPMYGQNRQIYNQYQHQHQQNFVVSDERNSPAGRDDHTRIHFPDPTPRQSEFNEKLGFSLSSLLPTSVFNTPQESSQESENFVETNNDSPFLDDSELFQRPQQSSDDNPALASDDTSSEQVTNSDPSVSPSSGLFSRIRNILPFGNGFLTGLFRGATSTNEAPDNDDSGSDNGNNVDVVNNANSEDLTSPQTDPNQISITNGADDLIPPLRLLPNRLQNAIRSLQSMLRSNLRQTTDLQQLGPLGGTGNVENGEGPISTLQSVLTESGITEGEPLLSLFQTVASTIGLTVNNAQWFILVGLFIGPFLATAIAASVIAIVYASIYVPAAAFRNEDLDGEFSLLSFRQVFEIFGIPDPLEDLFDFGKRSLDNGPFDLTDKRKSALLAGTLHEFDECFERFACDVIGRKLMGSASKQESWLGKGIMWIGGKIEHSSSRLGAQHSGVVNFGKELIKAVATGMSNGGIREHNRQIRNVNANNLSNHTRNACSKYICDPVKNIRKLFGIAVYSQPSSNREVKIVTTQNDV